MSVLIVLIPPRPRWAAGSAAPATAAVAEWSWFLSADGVVTSSHGRGAPATWPRADNVLALLADSDVAWHRITLPKAPAARLRQALQGVMEEALLDDESAQHFALPPDAVAGKPTWVAVLQRPWLAAQLAAIEQAGRAVERVLPPAAPGGAAEGHFFAAADDGADTPALQLSWVDADGHSLLGLAGSLARTRIAALGDKRLHWTATPASAAAAEAWLGQPVEVRGDAERALQMARTGWNLRQFDLAPQHRGTQALRASWRRFFGPAWRPVRLALLALVAVQLIGLNAWAWQQQRALAAQRATMVSLLQSAHPQVRAVLDPALQMTRETDLLRAAAGQPGDNDLETLLGVAAAGWPEDEDPVASLQFEPGRLTLGTEGWDDERRAAFRQRVQPAGWAVQSTGTTLVLSRASGATP
jgi:general secretion pathway protein L